MEKINNLYTFRSIRVIILYIYLLFSSSSSQKQQQQQQQQQQLLQTSSSSSSRAKAKLFNIVNNDRILLVGGINAMIGYINSNGFIKVFENEINKIYNNVTFLNHASAHCNATELYTSMKELLSYYQPTKVFISFDMDILSDDVNSLSTSTIIGSSNLNQRRQQLELLVAKIIELDDDDDDDRMRNIDIFLIPLLIHGESVDGSNKHDELIEDYLYINYQIARDYSVFYIELFYDFSKFLEKNNIDNLSHSVLTINGRILNDLGHLYTCLLLLKAFRITDHSLVGENLAINEERRVFMIKEELSNLNRYYQTTTMDYYTVE